MDVGVSESGYFRASELIEGSHGTLCYSTFVEVRDRRGCLDNQRKGAGEMRTRWLKVLAALPEDLGLIPRVHLVSPNCLELEFQGIQR